MDKGFHNVMSDRYILNILLLEKSEEDHSYFRDMFESIKGIELKSIHVENTEMLENYISLEEYDLIFIGPSLLKKAQAGRKSVVPQVIGPEKAPEEPGAMGAVYMGGRTPEEEKQMIKEVLFWIISDARQRSLLSNELKTSQRMLRSSEIRFQRIIEKNPDGIIIVDSNGSVLFVNPAAEELLGKTSEELIGREFGFPVVKGDFTEIEIFKKSLVHTVAEMRVVPIDIRGEAAYVVSLRNITERKRIEQILQENELKLRLMTDQMPAAMWTTDRELRMTSISGSEIYVNLKDLLPDAIGKTIQEIFRSEKSAVEVITAHKKALQGETAYCEMTNGKTIEIRVAPLKDEEGNIIGAVGIGTDITEQKNREKELQSKNKELDEFAYTISHDLKAPIGMINAYLQMLKEEPDSLDSITERIFEQSDNIVSLIDSVLQLSRAGRIIEKFEDIDMNELIHESFLTVVVSEQNVKLKIPQPLPVIKGDPSRMRQVFINLIQNAVNNRDPHKPECIIEVSYQHQDNSQIIITKDNGIGIPPENMPRIFTPAFTTRKKQHGTGFGLAITKKIIEAHGGSIWADSEGVEKGASFFIKLPDTRIVSDKQ